jgi:hypothetical protein
MDLPASPSLDCLELPPPWCCRGWVCAGGLCRSAADHDARIAGDYPVQGLAMVVQEIRRGSPFSHVVPAAVCTVSEIAQRAFGAFLIELPSVADLACAQQVNYLLDARKDCAVIDQFSHGSAPCV